MVERLGSKLDFFIWFVRAFEISEDELKVSWFLKFTLTGEKIVLELDYLENKFSSDYYRLSVVFYSPKIEVSF